MSTKKDIYGKFWSKVVKTNTCWNWIACKNNRGYGALNISGKYTMAHRFSWKLCFGEIPNGLEILHICDNPACVNPNHLKLGTRKDNMQDAKSKGRIACGEKNGQAILNKRDVLKVREMYFSGLYTIKQIAEIYSRSYECIYQIIKYKRWKVC